MSDSAEDRNLPASERKKGKARESGQVPRSRDLANFLALAVGGGVLAASLPWLLWVLRDGLAEALKMDQALIFNPVRMQAHSAELLLRALVLVLPLGALMGVVGGLSALLSGGWNLSFKALEPSLSRFNPIAGIGRLFAPQHLVDVLKMVVLAIVVGVVGAMALRAHWFELVSLSTLALPVALAQMGGVLLQTFGWIMLALGLWALVDVPLQRHLWLNRLKMTREEVKQEHKDAEGSAEVKGRIKARQREMTRRRMMAAVPTADLVVMNPTHYAVALKYDDQTMAAPRVVAKGADLLALRIRDLARDAQVPVLQAPPLARALYAHVELDHEIPAALFAAVAQVLAWVYQLRQRPSEWVPDPQVHVPPELDPAATPGGRA